MLISLRVKTLNEPTSGATRAFQSGRALRGPQEIFFLGGQYQVQILGSAPQTPKICHLEMPNFIEVDDFIRSKLGWLSKFLGGRSPRPLW